MLYTLCLKQNNSVSGEMRAGKKITVVVTFDLHLNRNWMRQRLEGNSHTQGNGSYTHRANRLQIDESGEFVYR
jgi:hypothetical protein